MTIAPNHVSNDHSADQKTLSLPRQRATYADIDWQLLWHNARAGTSWKPSAAQDWSNRSESFAERVISSPYVARVLSLLEIDRQTTILDVGCGPGTLALPLAEQAGSVTALDYAEGMLSRLRILAAERRLTTIRTLHCAWEDDWAVKGVGVHDVAIASRSLNIDNLAAAIAKLNQHASKQVYIVERIAPTPFDPAAFAAVGRPFDSGPDYIYTLNILYSMGIHPEVRHIEISPEDTYPDLEHVRQRYRWMLKDLTDDEEQRLSDYLSSRIVSTAPDRLRIKGLAPQRWALISWKKDRSQGTNEL
jgi:hypothetical protein